ncbi:MAG TPA: bacteriohemerythrin [Bryobacteraceae bacterium]|jgi:hemerythrin-like metal-binding protein|nr:bacteriohemerythrin [Bryobacteraceae bacterium]
MFEWNPEYSVKIASIDGQHQNLFRTAEELHSAMCSGQGKAVLAKILDRLVQYTKVHFAHEERLMSIHGYPDLAAHVSQHRALTKQVMAFQQEFESGKALMTVQVLQFLKDWLRHHIAESDHKYAPFLKEKAVA